jgi:hypothetical protein
MGFADRFASELISAFPKFDALSPSPENRFKVLSTGVYAMSSALTIAADPHPAVALLDMSAMIILGRMIYAESVNKGELPQAEPVLKALQSAERDILEITAKMLTPTQQKELIEIISKWHREHPEVTFFPYFRFSDFKSAQKDSPWGKGPEPSGLFKSVEAATQKVEEMRLLAERGIFLGTRLPMLTGGFVDVWLSRLGYNPEFKNVINQLNRLTDVSERFAKVAESLPDNIAVERDQTIKQAMQNITELMTKTIDVTAGKVALEREATIQQIMNGISSQRKQAFADFAAEEKRLGGVLSELRLALAEGNKLMDSVGLLTKQLKPEASTAGAKPFDIGEYRRTIADGTQLIIQTQSLTQSVDQLLQSPSWEKLQPLLTKSVESIGGESEKIINQSFRRGVLLILIWFICYVIARLLYLQLSKKLVKTT